VKHTVIEQSQLGKLTSTVALRKHKDRLDVETDCLVAVLVWISGLSVGLDQRSRLTLHRALLVLKWVTICRRINHSVCNQPPGSTQQPL